MISAAAVTRLFGIAIGIPSVAAAVLSNSAQSKAVGVRSKPFGALAATTVRTVVRRANLTRGATVLIEAVTLAAVGTDTIDRAGVVAAIR